MHPESNAPPTRKNERERERERQGNKSVDTLSRRGRRHYDGDTMLTVRSAGQSDGREAATGDDLLDRSTSASLRVCVWGGVQIG